jgi:hypothetical protein
MKALKSAIAANFGMKSTKHKRCDVRYARMEIRDKCRLKS